MIHSNSSKASLIIALMCLQVNLWGLDAIKTKGESVAIALYLVGARPLREATGRVARYELVPLEVLQSILNHGHAKPAS